MTLDPNVFKNFKPKAKDEINRRFYNIESELNTKIPTGFMQLVNEEFETKYPNNLEDFCYQMSSTHDQLVGFLQDLLSQSEKLDAQSIDFIDRLITQLYKETKGKGLGNDLWSHFPKVWNLQQIASDMEKINHENFSIEFRLNQVLTTYVQIYELTILFLTDITVKIAYKQRRQDEKSKKFCKTYRKTKMKGMTISRGELINYFNTQEFLNGWNCDIVQNSFIRNKIAHSDYYYDSDTKELIFGNKVYEMDAIRDILSNLYGFYCYLLLKFLQEGGIFDQLDQIAKLNEAIKQLTL